jgi:hypothetical protein
MEPLYPDCVFPLDCECCRHLPAGAVDQHVTCRVHAVNKVADRLGWQRPYPYVVEQGSDPCR